MRRILIMTVTVVAVVIIAAFAFAVSPAATSVAANIAARELSEALDQEVEIGAVEGDLLGEFRLLDIRFKDQSEDWATIAQVDVIWSPRSLLDRKIDIARISIKDAKLLGLPPKRNNRKPFKGFELPQRLPKLSIGEISIQDLIVDRKVAGETIRLNGEGSVQMGGTTLSVAASLKADDGRDNFSAIIKTGAEAEGIVVEARLNSESNGAIAALTRTGGAIDITVEGDGPPEAYRLKLAGAVGDAGSIKATATTNLKTLETIAITFTAKPGARFNEWAADLGETVSADVVFRPSDRGGVLELRSASAASGALSGFAEWRNSVNALQTATAKIALTLNEDWRPDVQAAIGDRVDVEAAIDRRGGAFAVTASARSPFVDLEILDGRSDLRTHFNGRAKIEAAAVSSLVARLKSDVSAEGDVSIRHNDSIILDDMDVRSADGARLTGQFRYASLARRIEAKGTLTLNEISLAKLLPSARARGNLTADFDASGALDNLALRLTATTPALALNSAVLPPSRAALSLTRLPAAAAAGSMSIRALDGSRRARADFARAENGYWRLRGLEYLGRGFEMRGAIGLNPKTREGSLELSYSGASEAEPWPGLIVEGEARASGALSRSSNDNKLTIDAAAIRSETITLRTVNVTASGPHQKLSFEASARSFGAAGRLKVDDVRLSGALELQKGPHLTLAAASGRLGESVIKLLQPASITLDDGLIVEGMKFKLGDKGAADFEGALRRSRWRAAADFRDIGLPDNLSTVGFSLDLDTARSPLATGRFNVRSTISRQKDLTLPGSYVWDGRNLAVIARGGDGALDVDLSLPLLLKRAGRLKVSFAGPLGGTARYRGRAETIAIFLPPMLQSLEGALDFAGTLGGSVNDPRLDGVLQLADGAYTELTTGISVVDIDLSAVAEGSVDASAVRFSATASGAGQSRKSIKASGNLDVRDDLRLKTTVELDRAMFSGGPVAAADASGALTIEGGVDDLLVAGDIKINSLSAELFTPTQVGLVDIDVIAVNGDGQPTLEAATAQRRGAVRYEIRLTSDDSIVVSGRGLNSTWRANAQIAGGQGRPLVLGVMNLSRGDLEFSGRQFDLTRGSIGFDTFAPNDPTIDIRAERETRDGVTVAVVIAGRSSALKVSLESSPSIANEEIMALILFDKPADQLSAFESLQVADALTQLGGVGVFGGKGVAGAARDALGLDLLNLEIDEADSSASLLTVGKYVTDGLFIAASQNARGENGSVRIEYEIGSSFSLETELRQDGDQTVSANWKRDF